MKLKTLPYDLTVCKLCPETKADLSADFFCLMKTDEEISLVCRTEQTPEETAAREDGWRAFRIEGVLDFSLTGIRGERRSPSATFLPPYSASRVSRAGSNFPSCQS